MCLRAAPILGAFLLVWHMASGQSFTQTFGGQYAQDGVGTMSTANGLQVAAREFFPEQLRYNAVLHATNNSGSLSASDPIDTPASTFLQDVVNASDGSAILVGSVLTPDDADHDGLIVKLNASGVPVWTTMPDRPGSQQYFGGTMAPDGSIVVCGVERTGNGHDVLVVRFTANGGLLWSHTEVGATEAEAHGIAVEGNDLIITGRTVNPSGDSDMLLMRMSLDGTVVWSQTRGGSNGDEGRAVVGIGSGVFVSAGWTDSYGMFDETSQRIPRHNYLIAFDLDGDTLWTKALGDTLYDRKAFALEKGPMGDLFIGGSRGASTLNDADLMRVTTTGTLVWERVVDTGKEERLTHILPLPDEVVCTGWSFGPFGRQVLIIRRNYDGF